MSCRTLKQNHGRCHINICWEDKSLVWAEFNPQRYSCASAVVSNSTLLAELLFQPQALQMHTWVEKHCCLLLILIQSSHGAQRLEHKPTSLTPGSGKHLFPWFGLCPGDLELEQALLYSVSWVNHLFTFPALSFGMLLFLLCTQKAMKFTFLSCLLGRWKKCGAEQYLSFISLCYLIP